VIVTKANGNISTNAVLTTNNNIITSTNVNTNASNRLEDRSNSKKKPSLINVKKI
jgi:hypothetical protein